MYVELLLVTWIFLYLCLMYAGELNCYNKSESFTNLCPSLGGRLGSLGGRGGRLGSLGGRLGSLGGRGGRLAS